MLNVHSDVVCPLLTHFTTMENLSSSASSSGKSYTSSAFLLLAANEPVARLAVAFPTACVPAKNPSSSVHHTFLTPPRPSLPIKPRETSLTSLTIPRRISPSLKFPPRRRPSRLLLCNSKPYLDVRFRLGRGYASHKTHTHHPIGRIAVRVFISSVSPSFHSRVDPHPRSRPTNRPMMRMFRAIRPSSFTSSPSFASFHRRRHSHHRHLYLYNTYPPFDSSPWAPSPFASSRAPSFATQTDAERAHGSNRTSASLPSFPPRARSANRSMESGWFDE
jgi:hypothetical protein